MQLSAEQRQEWRKITAIHGAKSSHQQFELWKELIRLPKTNIRTDFDLILVQPAGHYDHWQPTDVLVCRKWAQNARKQTVFSPESGFCSLITIVRGLP